MSQATTDPDAARKLELLREAARRANWDAQEGPVHLRSGRFFVSRVQAGHASIRTAETEDKTSTERRE